MAQSVVPSSPAKPNGGTTRHPWRILPLLVTLTLALFAGSSSLQAALPDISVALDKQSITLGDPVNYTLTIRYDTTYRLITPAIGATLGKLTVLKDSTAADGTIVDGRKLYKRRVRLTAFETGQQWAPSLSGELVDSNGVSTEWQTDSLSLNVQSMLGDLNPDSVDIQGLKAQYEVPVSTWVWWAISAFILVAAVAAYWFFRRRRRRLEEEAAPPPIPAWDAALGSLQVMREEIDPASDGGRVWYFRLSEILRRYLDGRYGWESIEETTTETIRRLPDAPFDGAHRERVKDFFHQADRVRYAKMAAQIGRPEVDWDWVRTFVETTIPIIPTEPELQSTESTESTESTSSAQSTPPTPDPEDRQP